MDFILVFLQGVLAFISPCILPMLPIYLVYLAGQKAQSNQKSATLLINTLCFVLGFTLVFVALGATASFIGQILVTYRALIQRLSGVVLIIFGLHYIGVLRLRALNRDVRLESSVQNLTWLSAFVFGVAFSFGWTPCVGPLLGSALTLAATKQTLLEGVWLLFGFSMGLGVPFVVSALLLDRLKGALSFVKRHFHAIRIVSGGLLIITGIAFLLNWFGYFAGLFA